jgi:hypothetical protein
MLVTSPDHGDRVLPSVIRGPVGVSPSYRAALLEKLGRVHLCQFAIEDDTISFPAPQRSYQLTLSRALYLTSMTRQCPLCGIPLTKAGSWFQSSGGYTCAGCKQRVQMTYDDKLRLFDKHVPTSQIEQPINSTPVPKA